MKKIKKHYAILTLSTMLLSTYATPIIINQPTILHAQYTLENATYSPAQSYDLTTASILNTMRVYHNAYLNDDSSYTLTLDGPNMVGGVYLSEKIDIEQPFYISGQINLGDKVTSSYSTNEVLGGDGISLLFLDSNVGKFGIAGESLGLGKIKNSFGFKLDTHHNKEKPEGNDYADADPYLFNSVGKAFGSFIYSNYRGNVSTLDAAVIEERPNNTFVPFSLSYGGKNDPTITVTYGNSTFTRQVNSRLNRSTAPTRAFGIFASTIDGYNHQQIKLDTLRYTPIIPKIVIQYVNDNTGETIRTSRALTGQLGSTKEIVGTDIMVPHYRLVRNNLSTAEGFQSGDTVTLLNGTQTVTYTYAPIYNELYPLIAKDNIQVVQNESLEPADALQNSNTLPNNSTLTWKEPLDTSTIGEKIATVVVTYPDNTTSELPVTIQVVETSSTEVTNTTTSDNVNNDTSLEESETPTESSNELTTETSNVEPNETVNSSNYVEQPNEQQITVTNNNQQHTNTNEKETSNISIKTTTKQKKALPKTGNTVINVIYLILAFMGASIFMILSRLKQFDK